MHVKYLIVFSCNILNGSDTDNPLALPPPTPAKALLLLNITKFISIKLLTKITRWPTYKYR